MNMRILQCLIATSLLATSGLIYLTIKPKTHLVQNQEFMKSNVRNTDLSANQGKFVSVKDFGAIGNNIADDTKAIQKAIDAVSQAGGGVVFFPRGTYKVTINPATSQAIAIRAKVMLKGADRQDSIIKLADKQGNYDSVLAGETPASDLSDFSMYDLTIDSNGTNNPVASEADFNNHRLRYAVRVYVGARISIVRCKFIDQSNMNVITVNGGDEYVADVSINNNIFEQIGGGINDYDHSTIYGHGKRIQISNNTFSSRNGAGTTGVRAAIETHGDEFIVKENVISGYTYGMNITGYAKSSKNQSITDNVIKDAFIGMLIWSYFSNGNTTNPAIENCTIANNKISLNVNDWRRLSNDSPSTGIMLEANSDGPLKNLNIFNNQISFTNFSGAGRPSDSVATGISLARNAAPTVVSENINISRNKIENSLAAGIYISMPIKQGNISQNTIINPGQGSSDFHDAYKSGIIASGVFEEVQINENYLIDNQKNNTIKMGILLEGKCVGNCNAKGNDLQLDSNVKIEPLRSSWERVKP